MALWCALNDPLLQLDWTLDDLLHESKLGKAAAQHHQAPPTSKPQQPLSTTPKWAAAMPTGRFDVVETADAFELVTDAPGFSPSDIAVDFHQGVLTISGKHTEGSQQARPQQQEPEPEPEQQQEHVQNAEQAKQKPAAAPTATAVKVWCKERRQCAFSRSFKLPADVKVEDIAAHLEKGVLTVRVPKLPPAPKPQPKRIAVQSMPAKAA